MKKLTPKEEDILSYFWTNGPLFIQIGRASCRERV